MRTTRTRSRGALALLLLAGSCQVGPDYEPPDLSARTDPPWRAPAPAEGEAARAELALWWERLGSAELDALARRLLEQNLSLAEARQRVLAARARRAIVGAERAPKVEGNAGYVRAGTGDKSLNFTGPPPGQEVDVWSLGAQASWELDLWGRVGRLVEAADAEVELAVDDWRDASVSLLAELALTWLHAHTLQQRIELQRRSIALQEETLRLARSRFEAGNGSRLDVEQAARELEATRAGLPDLERALREDQNAIAVLVGARPGEVALEARSPLGPPAQVGLGLPADLLARRADVRGAERRLAAAVARTGAAEAARWPTVSINGTLALRAMQPATLLEGADARSYTIGPGLSLPLFEGGRLEANVRLNEAQAEAARLAFERSLLQATREVEDAAQAARSADERVERLEAASGSARSAVELADSLYRGGLRTLFELVDAQRAQLAIDGELLLAREAAWAGTIRLYRALGGGWEVLAEDGTVRAAAREGEPR